MASGDSFRMMMGHVAFLAHRDQIRWIVVVDILVNVMNRKTVFYNFSSSAPLACVIVAFAYLVFYVVELFGIWSNAAFPSWMIFSSHLLTVFFTIPELFPSLALLPSRFFTSFRDVVIVRWMKEFSDSSMAVIKRERIAASANTRSRLLKAIRAKSVFSGSVKFPGCSLPWAATSYAFQYSIHGSIVQRSSIHGKS